MIEAQTHSVSEIESEKQDEEDDGECVIEMKPSCSSLLVDRCDRSTNA